MTALAEWYAAHGRHHLPWRLTRDPWAIMVSEVMLQQTQVARVETAWPAFMASFPTPASMGHAGRRTAADGWPAPDDMRCLPGLGTYSGPAVAMQAWNSDLTAADVNIT